MHALLVELTQQCKSRDDRLPHLAPGPEEVLGTTYHRSPAQVTALTPNTIPER